jgi:hypothetical protein
MPPLDTFSSQVNIVDTVISWTNKFESAGTTEMRKKSLWSSFSVVVHDGMRQRMIYTYIKSAILPVPTEMYRIELNEFIVLYSPLDSEAMKM